MNFHYLRISAILISISFCFEISIAGAQSNAWTERHSKQLHEYLKDLHGKHQFNGTVLLAEDGKVKFHESIGFSNIVTRQELDTNASFRLASVSKQFTCMGIMLLKKAGKLQYDDPVTKHLQSFTYDDITIRHLMHHTSGLPDYMRFMGVNWDPGRPPSKRKIAFNKDMVEQLSKSKPKLLFEPGEKFRYSNSGYVVLGHLIETISGQPIHQFFEKSIFEPLGMAHSHVFNIDDSFKPKHRVYGFAYDKSEKGFQENDYHYLNGMVGDGGIYASALDLLKWDQALYSDKLVPNEMLDEAFTTGLLNDGSRTGYGFGWGIDKNDGSNLQVSHGGGWVGFITHIVRNVSEKRTIIILTNHSSRHIDKVLRKVGELSN